MKTLSVIITDKKSKREKDALYTENDMKACDNNDGNPLCFTGRFSDPRSCFVDPEPRETAPFPQYG